MADQNVVALSCLTIFAMIPSRQSRDDTDSCNLSISCIWILSFWTLGANEVIYFYENYMYLVFSPKLPVLSLQSSCIFFWGGGGAKVIAMPAQTSYEGSNSALYCKLNHWWTYESGCLCFLFDKPNILTLLFFRRSGFNTDARFGFHTQWWSTWERERILRHISCQMQRSHGPFPVNHCSGLLRTAMWKHSYLGAWCFHTTCSFWRQR